eukprot:357881-Chlamydomonas_euryale.AAC.26
MARVEDAVEHNLGDGADGMWAGAAGCGEVGLGGAGWAELAVNTLKQQSMRWSDSPCNGAAAHAFEQQFMHQSKSPRIGAAAHALERQSMH